MQNNFVGRDKTWANAVEKRLSKLDLNFQVLQSQKDMVRGASNSSVSSAVNTLEKLSLIESELEDQSKIYSTYVSEDDIPLVDKSGSITELVPFICPTPTSHVLATVSAFGLAPMGADLWVSIYGGGLSIDSCWSITRLVWASNNFSSQGMKGMYVEIPTPGSTTRFCVVGKYTSTATISPGVGTTYVTVKPI